MAIAISLALRFFLVCVIAASFIITQIEGVNLQDGIRHGASRRITSTNNNNRRVVALYRSGSSGGQSQYQRDEGSRGVAMDQPAMVHDFEEEEERYVPASFNIDDYGPNTGVFNGHAIEMMAPVEVPEYGWNEDSRGLSELENGDHHSQRGGEPVPLSSGSSSNGGLVQCGEKQIDPTFGLCCNGLVYRKSAADEGKCCGSVAYDDRYFTCCQGRAIVRKGPQLPLCCGDYSRDSLPDQCRFGYEKDNTGLGSTCCRSASGSWTCCLKGESCCTGSAVDRSTAIEVPGFRPACCHLTNEDLTAQCCATTYEKIRVLPDCCERDRLKPVCCQGRDPSRPIKCCPGTIGYCCGTDERPVPPTAGVPPEFRLQSTRSPFVTYPPRQTYAPLPTYAPRPPTYDPRPGYTQRPGYTARPPTYAPRQTYPPRPQTYDPRQTYPPRPQTYDPRQTYPPRPQTYDPRPGYTQRPGYTPRPTHAPGSGYTTGYPLSIVGYSVTPRDRLLHTTAVLPQCCSKKAPLRQCCSSTKSPSCCQSARFLPRCCLVIYFNPACCQSQMQQQLQQQQPHQQQQQMQQVHRVVSDSTHNSSIPDVIPLDAAQTAGHDDNQEEPIQSVAANGRLRDPALHDAPRDDPSSASGNGHRSPYSPPKAIAWSNGRSSDGRPGLQAERQKVGHGCCRLDTQAAIACCRDGYQETGRLPACCVSSPVELRESNDADPTLLNQELSQTSQEMRLGAPESQQASRRQRRVGQRNQSKDGPVRVAPSKVTGRKVRSGPISSHGRPCNETSVFNEEEFICCGNVLRKRIGVSPTCCNAVAYDQLLYKCCDGKVRLSCRHDYKPKKSVWGVTV